MPVELQIIRASEFVRLDADEHLDFTASKDVLRTLAEACRRRGLHCAMVDLRTLPVRPKPQFTITELASLVGTFREAGFTRQQRLAILYRNDVHGGIRNFAFISRLRGLQVRAFSDFESAFLWLAEATDPPVIGTSAGIAIPISTPTNETSKVSVATASESARRPRAGTSRRITRR